MTLRYDHQGQQFGRLEVLSHDHTEKHRGAFWRCRCTCGTEVVVRGDQLRSGHSTSCGCTHRENMLRLVASKPALKHGQHGKPTYHSWRDMITRCTNPKAPNWHHYGGRGITVCDRWRNFANFLADMGEKPPGTSLERKNNNLGYDPDNCCWATPAQQSRNTRRTVVTEETVLRIMDLWDQGLSRTEIAAQTGVGRSYLGLIVFTIEALRSEHPWPPAR